MEGTNKDEGKSADDPVIRLELLKLLLQVAWADHEVQEEERAAVRRFATDEGIVDPTLEAYLDGKAPLPPPNMTLLRTRREEALFLAKSLARADLHLGDEEIDLLKLLRDTLYERG